MDFEIVESLIRFRLYGISGPVPNQNYGEVGMQLMNRMWGIVRSTNTPTTGINHWVYPSGDRMFVGVELRPGASPPESLEALEFELPRYLKHRHFGPYDQLPEKWRTLMAELRALGETVGSPSLEVYGHHCEDSSQQETTILIGLEEKGG